MNTRRTLTSLALVAGLAAGASAAALNSPEAASGFIRQALQQDEGTPQNLIAAAAASEGALLDFEVALEADEGTPLNLVA